MREILFRGKRIDNGEWITGDLITTPFLRREEGAERQKIPYILDITKADYDCFEDLTEDNGIFEVMPETVSQYTGLIDKDGYQIFENDLVKTKFGRVCKVVWFSSGCYQGLDLVPINSSYKAPTNYDLWNELEVVGNIFDIPELMKDGD